MSPRCPPIHMFHCMMCMYMYVCMYLVGGVRKARSGVSSESSGVEDSASVCHTTSPWESEGGGGRGRTTGRWGRGEREREGRMVRERERGGKRREREEGKRREREEGKRREREEGKRTKRGEKKS